MAEEFSKGVVLFWKTRDRDEGKQFGFISPGDAESDDRDANLYFDGRSLNDYQPRKGDRVTYQRARGGRFAVYVALREDEIETINPQGD